MFQVSRTWPLVPASAVCSAEPTMAGPLRVAVTVVPDCTRISRYTSLGRPAWVTAKDNVAVAVVEAPDAEGAMVGITGAVVGAMTGVRVGANGVDVGATDTTRVRGTKGVRVGVGSGVGVGLGMAVGVGMAKAVGVRKGVATGVGVGVDLAPSLVVGATTRVGVGLETRVGAESRARVGDSVGINVGGGLRVNAAVASRVATGSADGVVPGSAVAEIVAVASGPSAVPQAAPITRNTASRPVHRTVPGGLTSLVFVHPAVAEYRPCNPRRGAVAGLVKNWCPTGISSGLWLLGAG